MGRERARSRAQGEERVGSNKIFVIVNFYEGDYRHSTSIRFKRCGAASRRPKRRRSRHRPPPPTDRAAAARVSAADATDAPHPHPCRIPPEPFCSEKLAPKSGPVDSAKVASPNAPASTLARAMSAARPYRPSDPSVPTTSEECGLGGTPVGIQNAGSAAAIPGGASSRSTGKSSSLATEASPVSSGGGGDDTFLILDRSFARPTPFLPARLASHVGEGAVGMATNSNAVGTIPGEDLLSFPAELPGVSFLPEAAAGEPFRLCFPTDVAFLPPPRGDVFSADPEGLLRGLIRGGGRRRNGRSRDVFRRQSLRSHR